MRPASGLVNPLILGGLVVLLNCPSMGQQIHPRAAIVGNLEALQRGVLLHAHRETLHDPPADLLLNVPASQRAGFAAPMKRTEQDEVEFRFAHGMLFFRSERAKADVDVATKLGQPIVALKVDVMTPTRHEMLISHSGSKAFIGSINDPSADFPFFMTADLALGLRLRESKEWLTTDDIRHAEQVSEDSEHVVLRLKGKRSNVYELSYAREYGYALDHYRITDDQGDGAEEVACSDFRKVGDLFLPFKMVWQVTYRDSHHQMTKPLTSTLTVSSYALQDRLTADDQFMMHWPKGTTVLDVRSNAEFTITEEGTVITEAMIGKWIGEHGGL